MNRLIEKITGSDVLLWVLLIFLAVLNYGWIFVPALGEYAAAINGAVIIAIILGALAVRLWRHISKG
jgi:hypothetical protein